MPSWDSAQYLRFASERTQPAVDLAARIELSAPSRIIDLGSGPGNSTAVLARRWPGVEPTGLDSSPQMIAAAEENFPQWTWLQGDIGTWSASQPFDLVFSNAALQWVPDHARLMPHHSLAQVSPDGVLAFQMPANFDAPGHKLMRDLGASRAWRDAFKSPVREWHVESPEFYYDTLAAHASHVDLWLTDYVIVVPGPEDILEWYRGTGLRPWLDALPDAATRSKFTADYLAKLTAAYPRRPDGHVLFPFRRLFVIAHR